MDLTNGDITTSRTLTGAWIETLLIAAAYFIDNGRTLTGAWIETPRHSP